MSDAAEAELMRALHAQHAAALWSFALHLTGGDRARAEDVTQETLLRAWRHPGVLDQTARSARACWSGFLPPDRMTCRCSANWSHGAWCSCCLPCPAW